jgi:hypothetical protein
MTKQTRTQTNSRRHGDFKAAINGALVAIGEKFGLYGALAKSGPATANEFARNTGIPAHHVSSWLDAQARADYLDYDKTSGRFSVYCNLPSAA